MKAFAKSWQRFWRDDQAQSTIEYVLILFMVVALAMKFRGTMVGYLNTILGSLGQKMQDAANDPFQ